MYIERIFILKNSQCQHMMKKVKNHQVLHYSSAIRLFLRNQQYLLDVNFFQIQGSTVEVKLSYENSSVCLRISNVYITESDVEK